MSCSVASALTVQIARSNGRLVAWKNASVTRIARACEASQVIFVKIPMKMTPSNANRPSVYRMKVRDRLVRPISLEVNGNDVLPLKLKTPTLIYPASSDAHASLLRCRKLVPLKRNRLLPCHFLTDTPASTEEE